MANCINVGKSNIVACVWDFDKTLIPNYMEEVIFEEFGIDSNKYWEEVNSLAKYYRKQGIIINEDCASLNHMLTYIKSGKLKGLTNRMLREAGKKIKFFPGLPDFFSKIKTFINSDEEFSQYNITLEHYIISSGLSEIIKGSEIASFVDGIFACDFIEEPLLPGFLERTADEIAQESSAIDSEISQIGRIVDTTQKTRCIFEINKGCNKDSKISVNSVVPENSRRIPLNNMIYIADGPSDIPAYAVVRHGGGLAYAVYDEKSDFQFEQNDKMRSENRISAYGPADYRDNSTTVRWLKMQLRKICSRIIAETEYEIKLKISDAPVHFHDNLESVDE